MKPIPSTAALRPLEIVFKIEKQPALRLLYLTFGHGDAPEWTPYRARAHHFQPHEHQEAAGLAAFHGGHVVACEPPAAPIVETRRPWLPYKDDDAF